MPNNRINAGWQFRYAPLPADYVALGKEYFIEQI